MKYLDRENKFNTYEFESLPRNADGDVTVLADAFIWLTDAQVLRLTGDDQSRYDDYQEEVRCLYSDFLAHG